MDDGADLLEGDVELTEFVELDVRSVKGVKAGANGFPVLLMKGLAAEPAAQADGEHEAGKSAAGQAAAAVAKAVTDGQVDEGPDVALGQQIMGLLARAIQNEAAEIEAGAYDEVLDVRALCRAADMVAAWTGREQGGCGCCAMCTGPGCGCCFCCIPGMDEAVMASLAEAAEKAKLSTAALNDLPDSAFAYIEDGGSKDSDGKTTPRSKRHFAIHDKAHADNAAARIAQGAKFGDKAKGKVEAAQKKFGESDTSKSGVAEGETGVQTDAQETGSLAKAVEDGIAKAMGPLKERLEAFGADLAKVMAAPVPGGPVLSAVRPQQGAADSNWAAKAAYYRDKAEQATDPADRKGYSLLAREADEKAQAATA